MIDVKALVGEAMDIVFTTIPGETLFLDFHYKLLGGQYDPSTNSYPEAVVPKVQLVKTTFDYREINTSMISIRDAKFISKAFGKVPSEGDYFVDGDQIWDVIRLFHHPNLYVMHVRMR